MRLASRCRGTRAGCSDLKSEVEEPGRPACSAIPFRKGFDALAQKHRATGKLQGRTLSRDSLCTPPRINPWKPHHHPEKFFSRGAGLCFLTSPFSNSAKLRTLAKGIEGRRIILLKAEISKIQQNSTKAPEQIEAHGSESLAASRRRAFLPHALARSALASPTRTASPRLPWRSRPAWKK